MMAMPWSPIYPLTRILSPARARLAEMFERSLNDADAGCGDEDFVALTAIDDFRITRDQLHAGFLRRIAHGFDYALQLFCKKSFFENKSRRQVERPRAAHREIVYGAVDGQAADVAAGEENWRHHERVGREGQARAVDVEDGLVIQLVQYRIGERRKKNLLDELAVSLPPLPWPSTICLCSKIGSGQEPKSGDGTSCFAVSESSAFVNCPEAGSVMRLLRV